MSARWPTSGLPDDSSPDFAVGIGFADDATVIASALALVGMHLTADHYKTAADALGLG